MARTKVKEKEQKEAPRKRSRSKKPAEATKKGSKSRNPVIRYFQDTSVELKKVTWPTREQAIRLSVIVLVALIISTIFLWLFDLGFQQLIGLLV